MELEIEGRQADIEAVWRELSAADGNDFKVGKMRESPTGPLRREPAGMEPLTYFVVAFTSHLAASVAHDLLVKKLGPSLKERWKKLRVESKQDDDSKLG